MNQEQLFDVVELDTDLIERVCRALGFTIDDLVDNVEAFDNFITEAVDLYLRKYCDE